jgi:predicted RND superfamily exporter protein
MVAIVTVLPTLFPVVTAGAVLAASGEGLQFASIVALIVAFGLSLNAAVHYLNCLRLEDRPGEDPAIGVERATILIGPALVLTSMILAFGLGVTVLFGKLSALTLVAALVGISCSCRQASYSIGASRGAYDRRHTPDTNTRMCTGDHPAWI